MAVQNLFHVIHVVDDLSSAELFYGSVFPLESARPRHYSSGDRRWASLWLIGSNFVIEIMEASSDPQDRSAAIPKFHDRFGEHLHSLAWYSDDVQGLTQRFDAEGIRVVDAGHGTIVTHPKDTFGQLQFQALPSEVTVPDPRLDPQWARSTESFEHPLTLIRSSHVTTAVTDLEAAKSFYESTLDAKTIFERDDGDTRSAFVLVGSDTVVELAQPVSQRTRLARDLNENGQLPHSLCFLVQDLGSAAAHLRDVGVAHQAVGPNRLLLEPSECFGTVIEFSDLVVPGDPR